MQKHEREKEVMMHGHGLRERWQGMMITHIITTTHNIRMNEMHMATTWMAQCNITK